MRTDRSRTLSGLLHAIDQGIAPAITDASALDALQSVRRVLALELLAEERDVESEGRFLANYARLLKSISSTDTSDIGDLDSLRARIAAALSRDTIADDAIMRDLSALIFAWQATLAGRLAAFAPPTRHLPAQEPEASSGPTAEALTSYLRERFPTSPDLRVIAMTRLPGGRVKGTFLIEIVDCSELPTEVVLRIDLPVALLPTRTADEYPLLKALQLWGGVAAPAVLLCEEDASRLGGSFILVERAHGTAAGEAFPAISAPPSEDRCGLAEHLAQVLARLHAMPVEMSGLPVLTPEQIGARIEKLIETVWAANPQAHDVVEFRAAYLWLRAHAALAARGGVSVIHADIGLHNMLVDGPRLTALLDWELAVVGSPAQDLGYSRYLLEFLWDWDSFTGAYAAAGGPPAAFEPDTLHFYELFCKWKAYSSCVRCHDLFYSGQSDSIIYLNAGRDSLARAHVLLATALATAITGQRPILTSRTE